MNEALHIEPVLRGAPSPNTKWNVAHVLPWKAIGGTEIATLRVATSAAHGGYSSLMLCRTDAPLVVAYFAERGFAVDTFDPALLGGGLPGRIRESLRVVRQLRRRGVDLVHCADVYAGDFGVVVGRLAGCHVVCHVRNRYEWLSRERRFWLTLVDRIVFVSKQTGDVFGRSALGARALVGRKKHVLYDGIPTTAVGKTRDTLSTRAALGIPADAVLIGMVARLSVQKDHQTLIEAAEAVFNRHPRAFFLFVGDDGSEGGAEPENVVRIRDAIGASRWRSRFLCTGHRNDVPDLIASLDVFVLCTHREGFPLVLLEAMAQGKPVVGTAVDGIPEILTHEVTGRLHAHADVEQLAQQLNALLDDPTSARALGDRGRDLVEREFSERAFDANVVALYDGLLRPPAASVSRTRDPVEVPR